MDTGQSHEEGEDAKSYDKFGFGRIAGLGHPAGWLQFLRCISKVKPDFFWGGFGPTCQGGIERRATGSWSRLANGVWNDHGKISMLLRGHLGQNTKCVVDANRV